MVILTATLTEQIIAGIIVILFCYISWQVRARIAEDEIMYRKAEIKNLKEQIEWYDKWTDTLFDIDDMKSCYYQGRNDELDVQQWQSEWGRCTKVHPGDTFEKWIKDKYKEVEPVTQQNSTT